MALPDYRHVNGIAGEDPRKWLTAVPPWVHFRIVCYHVMAADVLGAHTAIFLTGHYGPQWRDLDTVLAPV